MRVLFLDDRDERVKWATEKYRDDSLVIVRTAIEAIYRLPQGFDLVSLDHDLNLEVLMDSNRKDCGMEVVRWIIANKASIPQIIIHSSNEIASPKMVEALAHHGYNVVHEPAPD